MTQWLDFDAPEYDPLPVRKDEGVTEIGDLAGRVVTNATFEKQWIDRCRSLDP